MHYFSQVLRSKGHRGQEGVENHRQRTDRQKHQDDEMEARQGRPRRHSVAGLLPVQIHAHLYRHSYGGCWDLEALGY